MLLSHGGEYVHVTYICTKLLHWVVASFVGQIMAQSPCGVTSMCICISREFIKYLRKGIPEQSIQGHSFLKVGRLKHWLKNAALL